jgi:hypothetical protein
MATVRRSFFGCAVYPAGHKLDIYRHCRFPSKTADRVLSTLSKTSDPTVAARWPFVLPLRVRVYAAPLCTADDCLYRRGAKGHV